MFLENCHLKHSTNRVVHRDLHPMGTEGINPFVSRQILQIYIPPDPRVLPKTLNFRTKLKADSDLHSWAGDWNESPN